MSQRFTFSERHIRRAEGKDDVWRSPAEPWPQWATRQIQKELAGYAIPKLPDVATLQEIIKSKSHTVSLSMPVLKPSMRQLEIVERLEMFDDGDSELDDDQKDLSPIALIRPNPFYANVAPVASLHTCKCKTLESAKDLNARISWKASLSAKTKLLMKPRKWRHAQSSDTSEVNEPKKHPAQSPPRFQLSTTQPRLLKLVPRFVVAETPTHRNSPVLPLISPQLRPKIPSLTLANKTMESPAGSPLLCTPALTLGALAVATANALTKHFVQSPKPASAGVDLTSVVYLATLKQAVLQSTSTANDSTVRNIQR